MAYGGGDPCNSPVLIPIARDTTVVTQCHCFFQSLNAKSNKDYPQAKNYGKYSLTMTVLNIFFTLGMALLITGLVVGCTRSYYYYYGYGSTYGDSLSKLKFGKKLCLSFAQLLEVNIQAACALYIIIIQATVYSMIYCLYGANFYIFCTSV